MSTLLAVRTTNVLTVIGVDKTLKMWKRNFYHLFSIFSSDENGKKLCNLYKPDVMICIEALQAIFASDMSSTDDWIIPMRIFQCDGKKVVIIDQPILKCRIKTVEEKAQIYAEAATKYLILKPWNFQAPKDKFEEVETKAEKTKSGPSARGKSVISYT